MTALIKKELSTYFHSLIGYIYLTIFLAFAGLYFFSTVLVSNTNSLNYVYSSLLLIVIFLIPILTMRLFSEEKRLKTEQALLTAPISSFSIVMGKYIAVLILYIISISITLIFGVVVSFFVMPEWPVIIGNFVGLFLVGAAFISIGMFISSMTENQVVAAIISIATAVFIVMLDSIASLVKVDFLAQLIKYISFISHHSSFTMGIFNIKDLIFFLSVCTLYIVQTFKLSKIKSACAVI